ncbi:hypothetical protein C5167_014535 [Papaver somniferum]|uniref:40S ribosomal protein SA n=1 Tax=Papaver somniferum TaxID=3469 RepID=A0A4Y7J5F4_PAPSO|nr:hypothetical protein C5167_014535 [Papaver somniferum]
MLLATDADAHLGTINVNFHMERYVFKRRDNGIYMINLGKTWEKLMMVARVIVAIENQKDIIVPSAWPYGQRVVLKFAHNIGAQSLAGRQTYGAFTNQMLKSFTEPRLLILMDPRTDQPIKEVALGNIPTIGICDTDSPIHMLMMVLQMRDTILLRHKWDVMVDPFYYREPEETKDQEVDEGAGPLPDFGVTEYDGGGMISNDQWDDDTQWGGDAIAAPALAAGAERTNAGVPAA